MTKEQITADILSKLPESEQIPFEQALRVWWMNFRAGGGLRLTVPGLAAFTILEEKCYPFELPHNLPRLAKTLLILDKKLHCPYYIHIGKKCQLLVFGSEQAVMLALYNDPEKWLDFLNRL
jgi:hypothetical protein